MDVELTEAAWVLRIPTAPHYTAPETSRVLGSSIAWVRACEALLGPASTDAHPIDHDALVRYVQAREQKHKRVRARAQLKRALTLHLEDEYEDTYY